VLILHAALTVLAPYLHARLRAHALSNAWPDAPSSDKRRKVWEILTAAESSYALLALLSFVVFLWNGR
jgi:peroxin-2